MRYHQSEGHLRYFITQLRESIEKNQNCQTPNFSRQLILQATGLSQNLDSKKKAETKMAFLEL